MKDRLNKIILYVRSLPPHKLLILATLLIIAAAIPITVYLSQKEQQLRQQAAEPTPPPEELLEQTHPRIKYDPAVEKAQFERIKQGKNNLVQKDLDARAAIISKVPTTGDDEGIVYVDDYVAIQYDPISDDFMAEILTSNINLAKAQTEAWFRQQGISTPGICNLPLTYILSPEVEDSFPQDEIFSTAPLACK